MNNTPRRALAIAMASVMAIAAGPAFALGLGQIQVKSHPGQPLLAEIPIISGDPAELQGLQVQLASPETFQRIGLEAPQGDVSQLHFEPAIDAQGRPVIRVTSPAPVQQPLLTFLLEVDWSGGRLVREYSALVDTPRTVAAPAQPPVEAPTVAAPNTIAAPASAPSAPGTPPPSSTTRPAAAAVPEPARPPAPVAHPQPSSHPAPPPRQPVAAATPRPTSQAPSPRGYAVRSGDTLAKVATGMEAGGSLDQAMLALLRANPQAFIDGNINRLKAGAVLRAPTAEEVSRIGASEAAALVHEQIAGWRQARKPLAQPAGNALASGAPPRPAPPAAPAARADARLEIAPPTSAKAKQAGTRSGLEAGGEGQMLRQQLQETKETLAARDAEVQELKARVAELEKIRQDQQQLIQMKSSALAAAQHDLAKSNTAAPAPAAAATQARVQPAQPEAGQHAAGAWLWSGLALVVVALVGWLATRRRFAAPTPAASRRFDSAALAASVPPARTSTAATGAVDTEPVATPPPEPKRAPAVATTAPSWHNGDGERASTVAARADAPPAAASKPVDPVAASEPPRSAAEQLDLAQAYLDVGDDEAARTLLREVLDSRDPAARETAARLLREL